MWLASILIINTLTLLTIAHADCGRPTLHQLKDDERPFQYGLFRDLKMNAKSMPVSYSMNRPGKVYYFSTIWPPSSKTVS